MSNKNLKLLLKVRVKNTKKNTCILSCFSIYLNTNSQTAATTTNITNHIFFTLGHALFSLFKLHAQAKGKKSVCLRRAACRTEVLTHTNIFVLIFNEQTHKGWLPCSIIYAMFLIQHSGSDASLRCFRNSLRAMAVGMCLNLEQKINIKL